MKKFLFTLVLVAFCSMQSAAQRFPITVIPQVNSPAPVNFYNYADGTTINSPLQAQLLLSDISISNLQVRLKLSFEGNGIAFESRDVVVGANPLFIDGGTPLVLRNTELAPYFDFQNLQGINANIYGQTIPEGSYQFCFEVFEAITGNRLSAKMCATTYIFKNEPPILNLPLDGVNMEPQAVDNIIFQWTPRHINVSNVEYELNIVEIWDDGVDPQTAFLSSPPIFTTTTRANTFVYGPAQPQLLNDKRYAWQVRAKALQGAEEIGLFKNEGKSEIFWFSKVEPCATPFNVYAEPKGMSKMNVFWDENPAVYTEYTIAYREADKEGAKWFTMRTNSGWATVWDLKPDTTYEYKVKGKCKYQYSKYSESQRITTEAAQDETANYNCGIVPDEIAISNREPHPNILVGDRITAGDFVITITDIESESNGRISGVGYVRVPYFELARFAVTFNGILINTDNQLAEGEIVTLYDPAFGADAQMTVDINFPERQEEDLAENDGGLENEVPDVTEEDEATEDTPEGSPEQSTEDTDEESTGEDTQEEDEETTEDTQEDEETTTSEDPPLPTGGDDAPEGGDGEGADVFIRYNGQNYKNEDVIEIKYDRDLAKQKFEVFNAKDDSKSDWSKHADQNSVAAISSLGIGQDVDIDVRKDEEIYLQAQYWPSADNFPEGDSEKVRVLVKIIREEFELVDLLAADADNKKRLAEKGQTLYLVNPDSFKESYQKVNYSVTTTPKYNNHMPLDGIEWIYSDATGNPKTQKKGVVNITRNLGAHKKENITSVKVGYPTTKEKSIKVEWVDQDKRNIKILPTEVVNVATEVFDNLKKIKKISDRFGKYGVKIEPKIEIKESQFNEEDGTSRFYNTIQEGKLEARVDVKYEVPLPPPYSLDLTIPWVNYRIGKIGAFIDIKLGLGMEGVSRYQKRNDRQFYKSVKNTAGLRGTGGLEFGLMAEILPSVESVVVELKAYGKTQIVAKGFFEFNGEGDYQGAKVKVSFEPMVAGFKGAIKAGDYTVFENAYEWQLLDRMDIYEYPAKK